MFDIDFVNTGNVGCYCLINIDYSYGEDSDIKVSAYQLFGSSSVDSDTGETNYTVEDFKARP